MADRIKMARLEFHDDRMNSHKFYEVYLDRVGVEQFKIHCEYGRCRGFGVRSRAASHLKDVVGSVIQALVVFQDWVNKKTGKGYQLIRED